MDIKQMIYFKTIVETGTISKAAQTLHMAQPPLSMQIKHLEDELGVQLFKRGHRKIELTPTGRLFYKRALQMIALHDTTLHEMKESEQEILRIGITSSNCTQIEKIQKELLQYPQLTFRIHEGSTYEMMDLLLAHNIDMAIIRTPFDQSQVQSFPLQKEPMLAIGHQEFMNSHMTHIEDYQHLPLIIHQRYLSLVVDTCLNYHFNPFIKMTSDDCRTSIIWAAAHLGVAIIPQSALPLVHDNHLQIVPLENQELYTTVTLITRKQEALEPLQQIFLNLFLHS